MVFLKGGGFTKAHKNPKSAEIDLCATTFTFLWGFGGVCEGRVYHDQVEKIQIWGLEGQF